MDNREKSIICQALLKSIIEAGTPHTLWEERLKDALKVYFAAMSWSRGNGDFA